MKYDHTAAKTVQAQHGVSNITLRIWKLRGEIPDHYFSEAQKEPTKQSLPDCSEINAATALQHGKKLWNCLMRGPARFEYRKYWESVREDPYWKREFLAELDSWGAYHAKTGDVSKPAQSLRALMRNVKPMQQLSEYEKLPLTAGKTVDDGLAVMLVIYEMEGWPGVVAAFPDKVKGQERKIQKALSAYNPKQNHWTKKPVGESYAQKAKAFAKETGGTIRVAKSGTIYVETPDGKKHRFADHGTDIDFDLTTNTF